MMMERKNITKRNLIRAVIVSGAAMLVTVVVLTIFATRNSQQTSTPKVDFVTKAAHRILNCTNPNGKCTRKNQKDLAKQIKQLINAEALNAARAASAGAYCSQLRLPTYSENLDCVLTQMGLDK